MFFQYLIHKTYFSQTYFTSFFYPPLRSEDILSIDLEKSGEGQGDREREKKHINVTETHDRCLPHAP